jgi:chloride channel protein, CIC family
VAQARPSDRRDPEGRGLTRFSSPQPNVPGKGIVASYGIAFWGMVVGIGVLAGLGAAALVELLRLVQHLAWSYHSGAFLAAVKHASAAHRVLVLAIAGLLAGLGGIVLRRMRGLGGGEVSEALWHQDGRMALGPSLARGVLSIVLVGLGASLGREAAPQLAGAAVASRLSDRVGLPSEQRRLLVACGAGAGMAAVYNVPLGGALFALEVLLGTITLPLVLPALATSLIATAVAWIVVPIAPTYFVPTYGVSAALVVWAAIVGPLAGLAAVAWVRLVAWVHELRPSGKGRLIAPFVVLTALGVLSIAYPQLLGNGKNTVQLAVTSQLGLGLLFALFVLKPLVTAACLGSGAPGGLFTPTLAYGVLLGGLLGHLWSLLWAGTPDGTYAIIGGGAVLAASMQGPLAAVVLMIELAHHTDTLMVPLLLGVTSATVVARRLGAPSIYSARLGEATARVRTGPPGPTDAERSEAQPRSTKRRRRRGD